MLILIMGCVGLALNIISVIFLHGIKFVNLPLIEAQLIALRTR